MAAEQAQQMQPGILKRKLGAATVNNGAYRHCIHAGNAY